MKVGSPLLMHDHVLASLVRIILGYNLFQVSVIQPSTQAVLRILRIGWGTPYPRRLAEANNVY